MNARSGIAEKSGFEFLLEWESAGARHCDRRVLNFRPDGRLAAPLGGFGDCLAELGSEEFCRRRLAAGELVPPYANERVRPVARAQFVAGFAGQVSEPEAGRYYPKAMIASALGCSRRDLTPLLVTEVNADRLVVDLNHPLARFDLTLRARRRELRQTLEVLATHAPALVALLTGNGPGMQAATIRPAWFSRYPFPREKEAQDQLFYRTPRLVSHIDAYASAEVAAIYARFITPGARVLDLMSSWTSHLSEANDGVSVTGLGLNRRELGANPRLDERVVHDLNRSQRLPFEDRSFDLVLCTDSVEYLTRPIEVFRDVARVLKSNGVFINTFSTRWFPPKAIRPWVHMHPFERIGLVMEYYRRAGLFDDLHSESLQGLPRPRGDKYYGRIPLSDPVFAVWARHSAQSD